MPVINFPKREISCKIVYCGPGLSGKTTNLTVVHKKAPKNRRGDLTSIATEGDRTLFFDYMPLDLGNVGGMRTKFQLYTVPGQEYYKATRRLVLRGADGVVFVADSQVGKMDENLQSLTDLEEHLAEENIRLEDFPLVLQWNKRDMAEVIGIEEMEERLNRFNSPAFEATAVTGVGVFQTLKRAAELVLQKLNDDWGLKPDAQAPVETAKTAEDAQQPRRERSGRSGRSERRSERRFRGPNARANVRRKLPEPLRPGREVPANTTEEHEQGQATAPQPEVVVVTGNPVSPPQNRPNRGRLVLLCLLLAVAVVALAASHEPLLRQWLAH